MGEAEVDHGDLLRLWEAIELLFHALVAPDVVELCKYEKNNVGAAETSHGLVAGVVCGIMSINLKRGFT